MTPGLRAKAFNIIDYLIETEGFCMACGENAIDIPADKIDEAVEKIIELMKKELDRDKEEE